MQNDVNGAGWCLPDYFHGIGIRYLSMGINQTRSILPFDLPTCFRNRPGKRVLAYRSDHYMTAFLGLEKAGWTRSVPTSRNISVSRTARVPVQPHRRPVLRLLHG
jgi:hypothetical protein